MHRESVTEALLGTIAVFQTGFFQATGTIDGIACFMVMFIILFNIFEKVLDIERLYKKKVRRAATQTDK